MEGIRKTILKLTSQEVSDALERYIQKRGYFPTSVDINLIWESDYGVVIKFEEKHFPKEIKEEED